MNQNGDTPRRRRVVDYAAAAVEQMEHYCVEHPGSPSAVRRPQLFFRGDLWIAFLGQTWKKALWGLARRSEPLSARLTRNTSLASGRLTRRTVLHEASAILHGATAAAARVLKAARTAPPAAFSSRETSESRRC